MQYFWTFTCSESAIFLFQIVVCHGFLMGQTNGIANSGGLLLVLDQLE